jgi:hypothetical protein
VGAWTGNARTSASELAGLSRRGGYLLPGDETPAEPPPAELASLRETFRTERAGRPRLVLPGERLARGLAAAPGRAVGIARPGLAGRQAAACRGAVLVAPAVRPDDVAHLWCCSGIVTTGGCALSHAGLLATQFGKPALIVAGRWIPDASRPQALVLRSPTWREVREGGGEWTVSRRVDLREEEHRLEDGDLVVLDAGEAALEILGHGADVLSLHEHLVALAAAQRSAGAARGDAALLEARGQRLRAIHRLRTLLARSEDPLLVRHAVRELLAGRVVAQADRKMLVDVAAANPHCAAAVGATIDDALDALRDRLRHAACEAARFVPESGSPFEILWLRARVLDAAAALECAAGAAGAAGGGEGTARCDEIARLAASRLGALRDELQAELPPAAGGARLRHVVRRLARLHRLLGVGGPEERRRSAIEARIAGDDRRRLASLGRRTAVDPAEIDLGSLPLVGGKAANLAEIGRLEPLARVPPWYAVTDAAFRTALEGAVDGRPLRSAIDETLRSRDATDAVKSARIDGLRQRVELPGALVAEVIERYRALAESDAEAAPPVAVRSSALEEDTEQAPRAGEFRTFLFVCGEQDLIAHLRLAWAGLWTERAIHGRRLLGRQGEQVGGGVVVQRAVDARASGVLQTVNLVSGNMRDLLVNAGLGLGQGVVSGTVAVDTFTISKDADLRAGRPRIHHVVREKRHKVVVHPVAGRGVAQVETLQHERMRPALEYAELCELARIACALEDAYGYPLDIEFAVQGECLWILQVRPIAAWLPLLRDACGPDAPAVRPREALR